MLMIKQKRFLFSLLFAVFLLCADSTFAAGVNFLTPKLIDPNLSKSALKDTTTCDGGGCIGVCVCNDGTSKIEFKGDNRNVPLLNHRLLGSDNFLSVTFDVTQKKTVCNVEIPKRITDIISSPETAFASSVFSTAEVIVKFGLAVGSMDTDIIKIVYNSGQLPMRVIAMTTAVAAAKASGDLPQATLDAFISADKSITEAGTALLNYAIALKTAASSLIVFKTTDLKTSASSLAVQSTLDGVGNVLLVTSGALKTTADGAYLVAVAADGVVKGRNIVVGEKPLADTAVRTINLAAKALQDLYNACNELAADATVAYNLLSDIVSAVRGNFSSSAELRTAAEQLKSKYEGYCKFVPIPDVCCCVPVEEAASMGRTFTCEKASGVSADPCGSLGSLDNSTLGKYYPSPLPASGNCTDAQSEKSAYTAGKETFSITFKQLQADAAAKLNPLKFSSLTNLIGRITKFLPMYMGAIAMVMYIWAGFLWMTASGNAENTTKSKTIIVWTTLGVIAMLASYMLITFVFTSILQITL